MKHTLLLVSTLILLNQEFASTQPNTPHHHSGVVSESVIQLHKAVPQAALAFKKVHNDLNILSAFILSESAQPLIQPAIYDALSRSGGDNRNFILVLLSTLTASPGLLNFEIWQAAYRLSSVIQSTAPVGYGGQVYDAGQDNYFETGQQSYGPLTKDAHSTLQENQEECGNNVFTEHIPHASGSENDAFTIKLTPSSQDNHNKHQHGDIVLEADHDTPVSRTLNGPYNSSENANIEIVIRLKNAHNMHNMNVIRINVKGESPNIRRAMGEESPDRTVEFMPECGSPLKQDPCTESDDFLLKTWKDSSPFKEVRDFVLKQKKRFCRQGFNWKNLHNVTPRSSPGTKKGDEKTESSQKRRVRKVSVPEE